MTRFGRWCLVHGIIAITNEYNQNVLQLGWCGNNAKLSESIVQVYIQTHLQFRIVRSSSLV